MILSIDNRSRARLPRVFLQTWVTSVARELKRRRVGGALVKQELRLIFLSAPAMKRLNKQYRGKNYATDVLSFETDEPGVVGELVICPATIISQADEHGLSVREEYAYMILHGVLHLLGFDHETGERNAKKMFTLQDSIFEKLI